jgi:hypothetical protein
MCTYDNSVAKKSLATLIVLYPTLSEHIKIVVGRMLSKVTTKDMVKLGINIDLVPYTKRIRKVIGDKK